MVQRRWSSLVGRTPILSAQRLPAERLERVHQVLRRRLDDAVEDVFQRACLNGDLDTARALLQVLEGMHDRRQAKHGNNRRLNDDVLRRARAELEQREAALVNPPPPVDLGFSAG
jgi:hypothetical protein